MLDLVKRAWVAVGAFPNQRWPTVALRAVAPIIAIGSRELKFPGAPHSPRRIWQFAAMVDAWIAEAGTSIPDLTGMDEDLRHRLEQLAGCVEGWRRPGCNTGEWIFGLPGWLVAERVRVNHRKPGTSITETQEFLVEGTGIRWLGFSGQEQNYGGKYILRLRIGDIAGGHGFTMRRRRRWIPTSDTGRRIAALGQEHWRDFVIAAHGTRAFRAMRRIGRDDLRTALWLSRHGPGDEFRRLQFAENLPELAAQILPLPDEASDWHTVRIRDAWEDVRGNAKPQDIGHHTWGGRRVARPRLKGGSLEDRIAAQGVASNRLSLLQARPQLERRFRFNLDRHQEEIVEAWESIDGNGLRELTWRWPGRFLDAMVAMTQVHTEVGKWIPASLLVRAMLRSGLDAVLRWSTPDRALDLHAAARDAFERSFRPQLEMAGYSVERRLPRLPGVDWSNEVVAAMVRTWLKLRFGSPAEQESRARAFPDAARDARQRPALNPKWRDLTEWSRRWHHPPRLRRAAVILKPTDGSQIADRLATPLVLRAGAAIGANMRRVCTMEELSTLAEEEDHCIASFAGDLRRGVSHCLVIEHHEGNRKVRSTLLVEERTRWVGRVITLARDMPYRVDELRMYRNAVSPPEHWQWARELVAAWCDVASGKEIRASLEESGLRLATWADAPAPPDRVGPYWTEITSACVPEWLADFDPEQALIASLYQEFRVRERGYLPWIL